MLLLEALNHTQGFSDGHRAIAAWLLEHRNEAPTLTTKQIARATFTSPAAVIRFAQKLGYHGFEELRSELARESVYLNQHFRGVDANQPLSANDSMMTVAAKVSALARETTDDTLSLMDEATVPAGAPPRRASPGCSALWPATATNSMRKELPWGHTFVSLGCAALVRERRSSSA